MKLSNTTKISHFIILFLICCSFNTLAININFLPPDSIKPDTTRPQKIIYQYDTLIVIDTIIKYDTVYSYNDLEFSSEFYLSPFFTFGKIVSDNSEYDSFIQYRKDSEQYQFSYLFGLAGNLKYKDKLSVSLGISYSTIRKKSDYNFVNITLTDQSYYNQVDNSYWSYNLIDSFYQMNPDTTWIVVIDTVYNPVFDSVLVNKYDTNMISQSYSDINQYKYIEFPVIFGYTFSEIGNFSFDIKSGVITRLLIGTKGKTILPNNEDAIVDIKSSPLIKTGFDLYLSARINYNFSSDYSLFLEPYYKKSLKSLYEKNYLIKEKRDFVGFRLGFEYYF